jgi:hypothetical protein
MRNDLRVEWSAKLSWAVAEHERRRAVVPREGERPDLVLTAVASASWAAGLAALMLGRRDEAAALLRRAAEEYVASWEIAPPGSWGRPIAALRCRLIAGDAAGASADADRALAAGALPASGSIQRYCGVLALLVRGEDSAAEPEAQTLLAEGLEPEAVAEALLALARGKTEEYARAVARVEESFATRDAYLEDVRVADTVLVLQELARRRGMAVALHSALLPV